MILLRVHSPMARGGGGGHVCPEARQLLGPEREAWRITSWLHQVSSEALFCPLFHARNFVDLQALRY